MSKSRGFRTRLNASVFLFVLAGISVKVSYYTNMENKLKVILDSRGIKYGWLAEQVGVNRGTIKNLMDGACPSLSLAYKIASTLNLTVYEIWPHS